MQLANYINDLLYRYECVIVPGFGAFISQYRSARIDDASQTFYPPGKTVMFNRQLQTNDGLLANYVASVENCSYESALQKIRNFVGKISLELAEGKTITLSRIGEFTLNNERSVQFVPSEKENFSAASFGLTTFIASETIRESFTEKDNSTLLFTPEKRMTVPYLKYAAIGLVALTVAGFGGMKLYENNVRQHNFVERQKANTLLENQIQEATFVIENPLPALNVTVKKQRGKYHVIAGAFRVEENAEGKLKELQEKGFDAKMIGVNRYGLHQVIYSSFENRIEALKSLRTIKRTENENAWLLVQELDM